MRAPAEEHRPPDTTDRRLLSCDPVDGRTSRSTPLTVLASASAVGQARFCDSIVPQTSYPSSVIP